MKFKAGTVYLDKDVATTFAYIAMSENFYGQSLNACIDHYEIELLGETSGPFFKGKEVSIFLSGKYEETEDLIINLLVTDIKENQHIYQKVTSIEGYECDEAEVAKELPLNDYFSDLYIITKLQLTRGKTKVEFGINVNPSNFVMKMAFWFLIKISHFKNKKLLQVWAEHINQNA
ncbi:hypothetical protein [Neptuniibacter sp.]|uniref:hypothetical protein n=1 Tax=Neptuniibacter sp. TaxID=1962643 RepID=UPI003B5CE05B